MQEKTWSKKPGFKVCPSYAEFGVFTGVPSVSPSRPQSGSASVAEHPLASALETSNGWSAYHGSRGNIYLVFGTRESEFGWRRTNMAKVVVYQLSGGMLEYSGILVRIVTDPPPPSSPTQT